MNSRLFADNKQGNKLKNNQSVARKRNLNNVIKAREPDRQRERTFLALKVTRMRLNMIVKGIPTVCVPSTQKKEAKQGNNLNSNSNSNSNRIELKLE